MSALRQWVMAHPRLTAWIGLAVGMLIIFLVASAGVGLQPAQRLVIAGVVVLLAGLCVAIIYWE